jgi:hypothetical protein
MFKWQESVRAWATSTFESVRDFGLRVRHSRYSIVLVGTRLFTVQRPRKTSLSHYYAYVKPLPRHRQRHIDEFLGSEVPFDCSTQLHFRIDDGRRGKFKQIEVVPGRWRRGWASDMVRALLKAHPGVNWQNESLNPKSGPLFERLSAEYPERIAKVVPRVDGGYSIGNRP